MTRINVGPYRLESYSSGWTVGSPRTRKNKDGTQDEHLADQCYYGSLTQALQGLQDTWLRESSATSFDELRADLKAFRAEIGALLIVDVKVPDKSRHRRLA